MSPRIARFQWDKANLAHIALHHVKATEIEQAFLDQRAVLESDKVVGGELRYRMLGAADDGRVLAIVFVIRTGLIRTVTAFSAKGRMLARYRAGGSHGKQG